MHDGGGRERSEQPGGFRSASIIDGASASVPKQILRLRLYVALAGARLRGAAGRFLLARDAATGSRAARARARDRAADGADLCGHRAQQQRLQHRGAAQPDARRVRARSPPSCSPSRRSCSSPSSSSRASRSRDSYSASAAVGGVAAAHRRAGWLSRAMPTQATGGNPLNELVIIDDVPFDPPQGASDDRGGDVQSAARTSTIRTCSIGSAR